MRRAPLLIFAAVLGVAACGPTVLIEGEIAAGGVGAGFSGGFGANGVGANGVGANGVGANGTGASGTGASGWGTGSGSPLDQWAKSFGKKGHQHLRALTSRPSGEIVVAGYFDGELGFEGSPLDKSGSRSGFVAELDPKGNPTWSVSLTGDDCAVEAAAVDASGAVVVTGFVKGSLDIGGAAVASSDGIFVAKLLPGGGLAWAHTYGSSAANQADRGLGVAITGASGVLVSGSYSGALDFGGPSLPVAGGAFVASLDAAGAHLWSKQLPGTAAFVASSKDRALVAVNGDGDAMRVAALDEKGNELWSHKYAPGELGAITASPAGDVLIAGVSLGADFGGGPIAKPLPNGEAFLVALDADGKHRWTRGLPFDQHQSTALALTVNGDADIAVTGSYVHHVDEGSVIQSAFVVAVGFDGEVLASQTFGPIDGFGAKVTQEGWGIAPAKAGGFYVGGDFYTAIDVAGASLSGEGSSDLFIAKLPAP